MRQAVEEASFDPAAPPSLEPRRWWGDHLRELRWQAELARLLVDPVFRGEGIPHGDGRPTLLIPGFLAGDVTLAVMYGWLDRIGYEPARSGISANVDCSNRAVERLERRLVHLNESRGRKVALIGHSRGGHFAKALASRHPDRVAAVISLGAGLDRPFDISIPTKAAVAAFSRLHASTTDRLNRNGCFTESCRCRYAHDYSAEFPGQIPLTSVYSKGDGVVAWESCVVPYARAIEVTGSHVGLPFNRKVYAAVAEALAEAPAH